MIGEIYLACAVLITTIVYGLLVSLKIIGVVSAAVAWIIVANTIIVSRSMIYQLGEFLSSNCNILEFNGHSDFSLDDIYRRSGSGLQKDVISATTGQSAFLPIPAIPLSPRVGLSKSVPGFPIADGRSGMHCAYMEHATLVGFLSGTLSPEVLAGEIATEVAACNAACEAGGSGYIIITDGPSYEVTREGAGRLLAAIAEERLSFELANYVADCLIMSDDFDFADDAVRDAIHFAEDDSRPPTQDETIKALAVLAA